MNLSFALWQHICLFAYLIIYSFPISPVAQLVEQIPVKDKVARSSRAGGARSSILEPYGLQGYSNSTFC